MNITNIQPHYYSFRANQNTQPQKKEEPKNDTTISKKQELLLTTNSATAPIYVTQKVINGDMKAGDAVKAIVASQVPLYSYYYIGQQVKNDDDLTKADAAKIIAANTMTDIITNS